MASHGFVVVVPWDRRSDLTVDEKIPFVQSIIDYSEQNLEQLLVDFGAEPGIQVDFNMAFGKFVFEYYFQPMDYIE